MPRPSPVYVATLDDDVVFRLDLIPGTDDYNWTKMAASAVPPGTPILRSPPPKGSVAHMSRIVAAYVSKNNVPPAALPDLMLAIHEILSDLGRTTSDDVGIVAKPTSAAIRKSIAHDHLVSFEDGKHYKTLRRHLARRDLTPEGYREKWSLPADYPMTAASYSAQRSDLARRLGLGQRRRNPPTEPILPPTASEPPERTVRRRRRIQPR